VWGGAGRQLRSPARASVHPRPRLPSTTLKSAIACVSLSIRDCELTARFQMPLSGFNERSTASVKLAKRQRICGRRPEYCIGCASTPSRTWKSYVATLRTPRTGPAISTTYGKFDRRIANRQLSSLRPQKPKHYDDGDADECQDRIPRWIEILIPGAPPGSAFAAGRDRDLVIGHGRRPFNKECRRYLCRLKHCKDRQADHCAILRRTAH
jgi:hypothetical protein